MASTNASGITGVHWYRQTWTTKAGEENSCLFAVATWAEGNSVTKNKKFNVNKLGLLPAFAKAVAFREEKIKELNELGYGYSQNHGK
jgi:hypothetical protein